MTRTEKWSELATFLLDVSYAVEDLLDMNQAAHCLRVSQGEQLPTKFQRNLISRKLLRCRELGISYKQWERATQPLYNFLGKILEY